MTTPRPGGPVRGSATGRPLMAALDLLGRRGALRILWELRGGPLTFRALQSASATNPGLLNTRLHELRELGIVDHGPGGYRLTAHGDALVVALSPLSGWAERWSADVAPERDVAADEGQPARVGEQHHERGGT